MRGRKNNPRLGCREGEVALQEPAPQTPLPWQGCGAAQPAPSPVGSEGEDFSSRQEPCCVPGAAGEEGWELQWPWDMGFSSAAGLRAPACCLAQPKSLTMAVKMPWGGRERWAQSQMMPVPWAGTGISTAGHPAGLPLTPVCGNELAPAAGPRRLPAEKVTMGKGAGGCWQQEAG